MKVIWDEEAYEGLKNLFNYYYALSPQAATKLYNDILNESERLTIMPHIGKIEPLLSDTPITYRSLIVRQNYKLIYFAHEESGSIVIVRLWDCRQDPVKFRIEH